MQIRYLWGKQYLGQPLLLIPHCHALGFHGQAERGRAVEGRAVNSQAVESQAVDDHHLCSRLPVSVRMGGNLVPVNGPALPDHRLQADEHQGQLRRLRRRKIHPGQVVCPPFSLIAFLFGPFSASLWILFSFLDS